LVTDRFVERKNIREISRSDLNGFGNGGQIVVERMGKSKTLAFVGHMKGKSFTVVDVSEPSRPCVAFQQERYAGTRTHKLRILKKRYLIINCERGDDAIGNRFDSGFRIFDMKDETNPREIAYVKVRGKGVHRFWIDEERMLAYMPCWIEGYDGRILLIYDLKRLHRPRLLSKWAYPGQKVAYGRSPPWTRYGYSYRAHGPPIRVGDRIYLGYWDAGTLVLDCKYMRNIKLVSQRNLCPPYGGATHTVLPITREIRGRKWLIVTDEPMSNDPSEADRKMLWVMDSTDEKNIVPVSTYSVRDPRLATGMGRLGPHNLHENDQALKEDEISASWYSAGVRILDFSDPYRLHENACYVPKPDPKKQAEIQTNDLFIDHRSLIYTIDRLEAGMHVLERNHF